jgi:hypothetical protein
MTPKMSRTVGYLVGILPVLGQGLYPLWGSRLSRRGDVYQKIRATLLLPTLLKPSAHLLTWGLKISDVHPEVATSPSLGSSALTSEPLARGWLA